MSYTHIDLSYLIDFSNGNAAFMKEIILISIDQTAEEILNFRNALSEGNHQLIAQICHKLRSSMGFMGISAELIGTLKQAEVLALANDPSLGQTVEKIMTACQHINLDLQKALKNSN